MQRNSTDLFSDRKICERCKEDKHVSDFAFCKYSQATRLRATCKVCDSNPLPKTPGFKTCKDCGLLLPLSDFYEHRCSSNKKLYPDSRCKACANHKRKNYEQSKPRKECSRRNWLKHFYGLTVAQYEAMAKAQLYLCAICGKPESRLDKDGKPKNLCVDHCHATDKVRELLCSLCNHGLGHFLDDPRILHKAIEYLAKHSS